MRVAITGSSSFVGGHIIAGLLTEGIEVVGLQRDVSRPAYVFDQRLDVTLRSFSVGTRPDSVLFSDCDTIIHLIHDWNRCDTEEEAYIAWYTNLERAASGMRQIYVSSESARPDAVSSYGRIKYRLEHLFLERGHSIVRPGLVLGHGALFGRIVGLLKKFPVLPVPGGASTRQSYISGPLLGRAMARLCAMPNLVCELNAFSPRQSSLLELLRMTSRELKLPRLLIPIPVKPTLFGLKCAESLGLKLPVTSDNLQGSMINQSSCHMSNLEPVLGLGESLEEAIRSSLRPSSHPTV